MTGIFKIVGRVKDVVAEELPSRAVQSVGAGLNGCVENGSSRTPEFSAEVRGLNLELLNRVDRGQHNVVGAVQEVHGVGIVINAVEHVIVLRRPVAIGCKGARSRVAAGVRFRRAHPGG